MATLISRFGGLGILATFGLLRARPLRGTSIDKSRTLKEAADAGRLRELESLARGDRQITSCDRKWPWMARFLAANESYLKMFGYSLAEIIGKPYTLFVDPVERKRRAISGPVGAYAGRSIRAGALQNA